MSTLTPPSFDAHLLAAGCDPLRRVAPRTLQVNVGKLCNQACHHCHVEAGPRRTEIMERAGAERVVALMDRSPGIERVDITGGAPEMNPHFRDLVSAARERGLEVWVRSNLTILLQDGYEDLVEFYRTQRVVVVASLPCYTAENVDAQRGKGAFDDSVEALRRLNAAGFGDPDSGLRLDLVYNPLGPTLPGPQEKLEAAYKEELKRHFGIVFNRLYTITNMPISRFADMLRRQGRAEEYQDLLQRSFNPAAVPLLMCRDQISVSWDGRLHDCDFNQMLELPLGREEETPPRTIWDVDDLSVLAGRGVRTGPHCFGCTAGAGSSCGGSLT